MSAERIFDWSDFPEYADYPDAELGSDLSDLDLSEVDITNLECVFCTYQIVHPNRRCRQARQSPRTFLLVLLLMYVFVASGIR